MTETVVSRRTCQTVKGDGGPCRSPPLRDGDFCFTHSPDHGEELAEARRLGGLRRRKERAVSAVYEFEGLQTIGDIRRVLHIAVIDTLRLENSVARARALAYLARVALRAVEMGEHEERLRALEEAVYRRAGIPGGGKR